jgi:arsenite transporter
VTEGSNLVPSSEESETPRARSCSLRIIQVYLNAAIAYGVNRALGVPHNIACPSALIGASNFFELAVAAAIALFGFQSGAALATVAGVLVEVPVMRSVVRIVWRTRSWYEQAPIA